MNKITLRPMLDTDIDLLTSWLHKPYIIKWYDDPEEWLSEVKERNGAFSWLHHFIVLDGETPIGFCQYYDCFDAKEDWYHVDMPGDTFSIDYLVGEETRLHKGYGKSIVAFLTAMVMEKEKARRIIVQPDQENAASTGVLLANGYLYDKENGYYCKNGSALP